MQISTHTGMETQVINSGYFAVSTKLADLFSVLSSDKNQFTTTLINKIGKKSQELYKATNKLIEKIDSRSFDESVRDLTALRLLSPLVDLLKQLVKRLENGEFTSEELKKIDENMVYVRRAINIASDFIEGMEQFIKDEGKYKLSHYIYLIDTYRNEKEENLKLNSDFDLLDIQEWE